MLHGAESLGTGDESLFTCDIPDFCLDRFLIE